MTTSFWGSASGFLDDNDEDGDGFEGEGQGQWSAGRDGMIFLIDCTEPMFKKNAEGQIPFEICVKCARNVLMGKCLSNDGDLVAVIFYGTDKSQNPNDFKNVCIVQDLGIPDANRILELETLMEDYKRFADKYGHSYDFSFADALWTCSNMFANRSVNPNLHSIAYGRLTHVSSLSGEMPVER